MATDNKHNVGDYAGSIATQEGIVIVWYASGAMNITDYLDGGINVWCKVKQGYTPMEMAYEVISLNGWHI